MSETLFGRIGAFLHRRRPWYELPGILAVPKLVEIRNELRQNNLHDTEDPPLQKQATPDPNPKLREERSIDGSHNDLHYPKMGCAGARFGRNFPLEHTFPDKDHLLDPNPRVVSRELMTRREFQPATILNLMAASWIQFMVHDWFVHRNAEAGDSIEVPVAADDPFPAKPMRVPKTMPAAAPPGSKRPPAYENLNSHWWDASQIYGCDAATASSLRANADGKLKIGPGGLLPVDPATQIDQTGFVDNWWIGLSMLHTLFVLEHNHVCSQLKAKFPAWSDDQIYCKARLINAALMAKIHTVEWTPAILPHPIVAAGLRANWAGLAGEGLQDVLEFLDESEILGGIVGSAADHHTAPYSLTEEFVAVYRMHPLMPDTFVFRSAKTGEALETLELPETSGRKARPVAERISMTDLFYSFGVSHPGALSLHNYPRHLQNLVRNSGEPMDLAAIDILRDRERGVPRYNQFRRLLHKEPVNSFEELTSNAEWREELRRVYDNDLEKVDLMTGLYAEPLPQGFGFSETAFRVFILMASRRLKSDRFFTDDYRPEIYTQMGLDHIRHNGMASILKRHYPQLAGPLEGIANPFAPWRATQGAPAKPAAGGGV
jgi:Animal haem peroxidase